MEFDRPPSRPVIKSVISAQAEWENWLRQNNFEFFKDADGLDWRVSMTTDQLPNEASPGKGRWITVLQIGVDCPISAMVETGSFDPVEDARLIGLASERPIPLRVRRLQYEANSESEMRDTLVRALPELRENFRKTSLHEVKRALVGRWVEGARLFGQGPADTGRSAGRGEFVPAASKKPRSEPT